MIQLCVHYSDDPGQVPRIKKILKVICCDCCLLSSPFFDSVGKE